MSEHPRNTPQFYLTAPSPCPYLPDREERKVFTHIVGTDAARMNDMLTLGGFRRSQTIAYRPACENCRACVSVRVRVDNFDWTRSLRRNLATNADLIGTEMPPHPTSEQYSLFRRYIESRHGDGGMVRMTALDYAQMIEDSHVRTKVVEYRRRGPDTAINGRGSGSLLAAVLIDRLGDGLSMVYSFYDPEEAGRGLGTFMILDHIRRTIKAGLPYLYLGYLVEGSVKMAYKGRFRPQERLRAEGWVLES
ncbi:putative arginyl-tRNA--protein transferase [Agaricicola taiwanensis]|uniref:Aspartate/glutamate leucyltransferase n=1 Tax=Agaricicola taiwanensis TaxID=591372 RepID=A0A8J2YJK3_9RHOB|nr:arginyltransferase [Agaricicola taiwanensis]GGE46475.1 putative arginyl-tRNA--protein transferase [Agaricicola taiwanensis]